MHHQTISRRQATFGILGGLMPWRARAAASEARPNFLVVLSDDVGWGDFQCYNPQGRIPTPNLNRMAREGMRFTDAHTPAALCAPTRYSIITGNYPWRGRMPNGTWGYNQAPQFLPGQKTVAHVLQSSGYRTAMFGKVHYGGVFETDGAGKADFSKPMRVGHREWGFDYSYVLLGGHQAPPYFYMENNRMVGDPRKVEQLPVGPRGKGHVGQAGPGLPDWDNTKVGETLTTKAIAFVDDHLARNRKEGRTRPFFIHFCSDGAHSPYNPPEELLGTGVKGSSGMTAHTDMVHEVDVIVGKLTEALAKRGLLSNTLIIATSDNGGLPFEREHGHDAVGGLRGYKSFIFEGGHRVPFLARWGDGTPGGSKIPPGAVRNQVIGIHDIVPTFAELAGAELGADQALDSVSLAPVLLARRGDDQPVRTTLLVQSSPGRDAFSEARSEPRSPASQPANAQVRADMPSHNMAHALREGQWKLTIDVQDEPAALYDLGNDLAEKRNLLRDPSQAERVKRMTRLYREIRQSKRSTPPLRG